MDNTIDYRNMGMSALKKELGTVGTVYFLLLPQLARA
jgi:hypothetical protein